MKSSFTVVFRFLASMKTGIALFCILLAAGIAGSLLPFSVSARWIYRSLWFNAILGLIILSTLTCLISRFPFRRGKIPGFLLHLGIVVLAAGFVQYNLFSITGTISLSEGESVRTALRSGEKEISLPFVLKLETFVTETNPVSVSHALEFKRGNRVLRRSFSSPATLSFGTNQVAVLNILRDFRILEGRKITDVSTNWNNPGIRIRTPAGEAWLFALYPEYSTMHGDSGTAYTYKFRKTGGSVSRFASTVRITPDQREPFNAVIEVNKPLRIAGYSVYQYSYDPKKPGWTELMVRKESGNILILAGFFLITAGLFALLFIRTILSKEKP